MRPQGRARARRRTLGRERLVRALALAALSETESRRGWITGERGFEFRLLPGGVGKRKHGGAEGRGQIVDAQFADAPAIGDIACVLADTGCGDCGGEVI